MFKEQLKAKMKEQEALVNKAIAENRALTAEEQTKFDELEVAIKGFEKTIEAQAKIEAREKEEKTVVTEPLYAEARNPNEKKWNGLGEYFTAVKNASSPGGTIDNRLMLNAATGNNTNVGADGGFLIEKEFRTDLMDAMLEESEIASKITMIPIGEGRNGIKWADIEETSKVNGYRNGGALAYWASEAETVTASKIKLNKTEIELEKLMAFWYSTSELLSDASAMEKMAKIEFANAMSFVVDDALFAGTGIGKPLGMLRSSALVTVDKESGQAADTILHENIQKMWNRLDLKSRKNAIWYINQEDEPELENMVLPIGVSGAISPLAKEYIERGTLKNRPVVAIQQASKLGDKGDIMLCDPTKIIGIDKNGIQADVSIHVKFLYDESCFRFIYRMNAAPRKNYAVASYKNAAFTTSPFVTLAERA